MAPVTRGAALDPTFPLIAGQYEVDLAQPTPMSGGGLAAWAAHDRRAARPNARGQPAGTLMALRIEREAPARMRAFQALTQGIDGLSMPLATGVWPDAAGQPAGFAICEAPAGIPLLATLRPWPESAIIEQVLRPIARVLDTLQARGVTHRAIRPNNVFLGQPNGPATLGAAWSAPPAMHQPTVCESAYAALCHPSGRGEGRGSDDVYALGVLLLTLCLGRVPMDGMDDAAIIHRKLDLGDAAALMGGERVPPQLADLIRAMLAEDPDHRPLPSLLRDPAGARGRRLAARAPARAARTLNLGAWPVWNQRTLAYAIMGQPHEAAALIRDGAMMFWLRRGLGDTALALKLEELARQAAQNATADREVTTATLAMRAAAAADPLMPLGWRGLMFFPDATGAMLARDHAEDAVKLREVILTEAISLWASMREERFPAAAARLEARQWRVLANIKGPAGGMPRLMYALNPARPCASPLLAGTWIAEIGDLPRALDALAQSAPETELIDAHIAAFLGAHADRAIEQEVKALVDGNEAQGGVLILMRLLAALQGRYHRGALPGLTRWVAARASPLLARWRNRERRAAVEARLKALAEGGMLPPILALLADDVGQKADASGLIAAREELARLDATLRAIAEGGPYRAALSARLGQEIAAGVGLLAAAATLILTALG